MKKLFFLLFAVITAIIFNSCTKDETKTSNFTGYYNSKSIYQNDLLLRIVSATGTSSFFGTGSETDLTINTNLFVSKTTGVKTITRINKTLDSIRVYELDKPELGGLLYVIKNNTVSVHQFEFVGTKNKIKTTYFYTTLPIPAGRYNSSNTNDDGGETLIDKAIEKFYKFTQTLGFSEVWDSIKESASNAKENAIKNWENAKQSRKELSDYLNNLVDKNPEPIKVPLEEDPINQDEQKVIDDTVEEPFDCNTSTLAMTISDPKITNGVASVTTKGIGGVGRYNYKWSDGQVGDYAFFSKSGTYSVTVTDGNGCSISSSVVIKIDCSSSTLAVTTTTSANSATASVTGGQSPYTYVWSNGSTSATATNLIDGTYTLTVKDAQGCTRTGSAIVSSCDDTTAPYPSVTIGSQVWMQKNLNVCKYSNGDDIPQVQDPIAWDTLTTGAWCYYNNDTANGPVYGKLYNWYAVNDPRGLAPQGYHIPSDAEWTTLVTFLDVESSAGEKMKATTLWTPYGFVANTNSSGFTGLPGGYCSYTFKNVGSFGYWWSSSVGTPTTLAWGLSLSYGNSNAYRSLSDKPNGRSVRCLRD